MVAKYLITLYQPPHHSRSSSSQSAICPLVHLFVCLFQDGFIEYLPGAKHCPGLFIHYLTLLTTIWGRSDDHLPFSGGKLKYKEDWSLVSGQTRVWSLEFLSLGCVFSRAYSFCACYPIRGSKKPHRRKSWLTLFKPVFDQFILLCFSVKTNLLTPSPPPHPTRRVVFLTAEFGITALMQNTWFSVLSCIHPCWSLVYTLVVLDWRFKSTRRLVAINRISQFLGSCSQNLAGPSGNGMHFPM